MDIQTKFNVGDEVYPAIFSYNTKKYVTKLCKVVAIFISLHEKTYIDYTVDLGFEFVVKNEKMVFGTKNEIDAFLWKYNDRTWQKCPLCLGDGFTEEGEDCPSCLGEGCFEDNIDV